MRVNSGASDQPPARAARSEGLAVQGREELVFGERVCKGIPQWDGQSRAGECIL